jgi:hypothetical protein
MATSGRVIRAWLYGLGKNLEHLAPWVYFLVEAPAFMRGKERFSAPGKSSASITRFSAGH